MADIIGPVRSMFKETDPDSGSRRVERIHMGTNYSGIVIDVTRIGLEVMGYYTGFNKDKKYSNLREPVKISYDDLEKVKEKVFKPKPKKNEITPEYTETEIDQDYLDSLPIVTINNNQYYIDTEKRERREIRNQEHVFKY